MVSAQRVQVLWAWAFICHGTRGDWRYCTRGIRRCGTTGALVLLYQGIRRRGTRGLQLKLGHQRTTCPTPCQQVTVVFIVMRQISSSMSDILLVRAVVVV